MSELPSEPREATATALLRECQERRLEREGVPMFLALVDEHKPTVESRNAAVRAEGAAYADLLERYRHELVPAPAFRDGDEGSLITALVVLAYVHFAAPQGGPAR